MFFHNWSSEMTPITYISEQPQDYVKALDRCRTLKVLQHVTHEWREVAADAAKIAKEMTETDFEEWRKGLALERRGQFAGEQFAKKYGALQMPEVLFKVSIVAQQFGAPWGCAYLRLKETGNLDKALA